MGEEDLLTPGPRTWAVRRKLKAGAKASGIGRGERQCPKAVLLTPGKNGLTAAHRFLVEIDDLSGVLRRTTAGTLMASTWRGFVEGRLRRMYRAQRL